MASKDVQLWKVLTGDSNAIETQQVQMDELPKKTERVMTDLKAKYPQVFLTDLKYSLHP